VRIDTSQFEAVGRDIARNGGAVGAKAAAAFRKTIHDIEADAKVLAPVDTGALRNSLSSDITGDGRFTTMTGEVGGTVDYEIWQEIGTSTQPGTPHLAPAFDRRVPPFIEAVMQIGAEIL
jgi:hypothetical protein